MLEHGVCTWEDLKLSLQAATDRRPRDLASKLSFMKETWERVGSTFTGETWAGERKQRAGALLSKSALLALIGSWGRTQQFRYTTTVGSHPDECAFTGQVLTSPNPGSTVFHDTTFRQEVLSHGTFLCLNLIARSSERLNIAGCISICLKHMRMERILSIQVDAVCFRPPRKVYRAVIEELQDMTYNKIHLATRRPLRKYAGPLQKEIRSTSIEGT
jgi:hypothetical protein